MKNLAQLTMVMMFSAVSLSAYAGPKCLKGTKVGSKECSASCCLSDDDIKGIYEEGLLEARRRYAGKPILSSRWADKKAEEITASSLKPPRDDDKRKRFFDYYVKSAKSKPGNFVAGAGLYVVLPDSEEAQNPQEVLEKQLHSADSYADDTNPSLFFVQIDPNISVVDVRKMRGRIKKVLQKRRVNLQSEKDVDTHFLNCCIDGLGPGSVITGYDSRHPDWAVIRDPNSLQDFQATTDVMTCDQMKAYRDKLLGTPVKPAVLNYFREIASQCMIEKNQAELQCDDEEQKVAEAEAEIDADLNLVNQLDISPKMETKIDVVASEPEPAPADLAHSPGPKVLQNMEDIGNVRSHVQSLIQSGMKPEEIVLVFDVDGTLTNYSSPELAPRGKTAARPNALELLEWLKNTGVKLVASSAHPVFADTLRKLKQLGMSEYFGVDPSIAPKIKSFAKYGAEYYQNGNVISVRKKGEVDFLSKALAPLIAFKGMAGIKRVALVDDQQRYHDRFSSDVEDFHPYAGSVTVDHYGLTKVGLKQPKADPKAKVIAKSTVPKSIPQKRALPSALPRKSLIPVLSRSSSAPKKVAKVDLEEEEVKIEHDAPVALDQPEIAQGSHPVIEHLLQVGSAQNDSELNTKMISTLKTSAIASEKPLEELFAAPNNREMRDTIEQHTQAVMDSFFERYRNLDPLSGPNSVRNLEGVLRLAISLHDIGKPIAGSKSQHEHTARIIDQVSGAVGLKPSEVSLVQALVLNDCIGEYMKVATRQARASTEANHCGNPKEAPKVLKGLAKKAGMPAKDFIKIQRAFFEADATYYKTVRELLKNAGGAQKLNALEAAVSN